MSKTRIIKKNTAENNHNLNEIKANQEKTIKYLDK